MCAIKDGAPGGLIGLSTVKVIAADLAEEDLALHAKAATDGGPVTGFNEAGDHLELRAEGGVEFSAARGRGDLESPRAREGRGPELLRGGRINGVQYRSIKERPRIDGVVSDARIG